MTTQEENQLLLIDLCARLPYSVKCEIDDIDEPLELESIKFKGDYFIFGNGVYERYITEIKPYLRPMSSMTEEEAVEIDSMGFAYWTTMINNDLRSRGPMSLLDAIITHHKMVKLIDWLNAHHFDYRGLIPMGLALEAPEGMY